jgi:hypothetical protein
MPLHRSANGGLYGTIEVLLVRMVNGCTETIIGEQSPFGGILVSNFEGSRYIEEPDEFWISKGFTITVPPILEEARRLGRWR